MKRKMSIEQKVALGGIILITPSLLSLVIFIFKPLIDSFVMSFKEINFLTSSPEKFIGFKNYEWLFNTDWFWAVTYRTVVITVIVTGLQVILSLIMALVLDFDFPGQKFLRTLLVTPWAIPVFVAALMWKWMYSAIMSPFGDILVTLGFMGEGESILGIPGNAMVGLIVALTWHGLPFIFLVVYSGLQQVPNEIKESAMIDGANWFQLL